MVSTPHSFRLKEEMTSEEELLKMAMMSINDDESQGTLYGLLEVLILQCMSKIQERALLGIISLTMLIECLLSRLR